MAAAHEDGSAGTARAASMSWPPLPPKESGRFAELEQTLDSGQVDPAKAALRDPVDDRRRAEDRAGAIEDRDAARAAEALDRGDDEAIALRAMAYAADYDRSKKIYDSRVEVLIAGLDHAHAAAEFVRNAAAGILALYQAVVGLAFVAKDHPLPVSGVVSAVFLALTIASATAYIAWLSPGSAVASPRPAASLIARQQNELNAFSDWVAMAVLRRAYWMHVAVVSLFVGAIALPLPFLTIPGVDLTSPMVVAELVVFGLGVALILPPVAYGFGALARSIQAQLGWLDRG